MNKDRIEKVVWWVPKGFFFEFSHSYIAGNGQSETIENETFAFPGFSRVGTYFLFYGPYGVVVSKHV